MRGVLIDTVAFTSKSQDSSEDKVKPLEQRLESMLAQLLSWEDEMESCRHSHSLYTTREQWGEIWKRAILHETEESWLGQQYDRFASCAAAAGRVPERIPRVKDSAIVFKLLTEPNAVLGEDLEYRRPFVITCGLMDYDYFSDTALPTFGVVDIC